MLSYTTGIPPPVLTPFRKCCGSLAMENPLKPKPETLNQRSLAWTPQDLRRPCQAEAVDLAVFNAQHATNIQGLGFRV